MGWEWSWNEVGGGMKLQETCFIVLLALYYVVCTFVMELVVNSGHVWCFTALMWIR